MPDHDAPSSDDGDELSLPSRRYLQAQAWHIAALLSRWYPQLSVARREKADLLQVLSSRKIAVVTFTVDTITFRGRGPESLQLDWLDVFATPFPDTAAATIETGLRSGEHVGGERRESTTPLRSRPLIYVFIARFLALTVHDGHRWDVFQIPARDRTPENPANRAMTDLFRARAALYDNDRGNGPADLVTSSHPDPIWVLTRDGAPELLIDTDGAAATRRTAHSVPSLVATYDGNVDVAVATMCGTLLP